MGARHVLLGALVSALAGCSASAPSGAAAVAPVSQPALPACREVFVPGKVVDKAKAAGGCTSPSGTLVAVGAFDCSDGQVLWQVDASTGAPAGYAHEGKPYVTVKGDAAADPGYKRAYNACIG